MAAEAQHDEQLAWERRAALPVAVCAVLAGLLFLQELFVQGAIAENRPGIERGPDSLLTLHDHTGALVASSIAKAIGVLLLIPVFFFLFRATRYRSSELPEFFKWLIVIGPLLYAFFVVAGLIEQIDLADKFANGLPIRGEAGGDRATDLADPSPFVVASALAGTLAVAFLFVMLSLRAMRAGLLSRFMGVLGVVVGALTVLPVFAGAQQIITLFWLGALAALFLGRWPNGRGPAWESAEADPWPSPAQRRGLLGPAGEDAAASSEEPEAAPQRPASRKRKRR